MSASKAHEHREPPKGGNTASFKIGWAVPAEKALTPREYHLVDSNAKPLRSADPLSRDSLAVSPRLSDRRKAQTSVCPPARPGVCLATTSESI